jgi:hypothetical protein
MAETEATKQLRITYGWMPTAALKAFINAYLDTGSEDTAIAMMRQDRRYDQWFPGNLTDDGRPRYPEETYAQVVAGYDDAFRSVGLNPALFQKRYGELIEGDVAPTELLQYRITPMFERIVEASEPIRAEYARMHGLELTNEALLASVLDPDLGREILAGQITMAQISGEAKESGYAITQQLTERLYRAGVDREAADELFMQAENLVPVMNVLARRHADPDDTFDLEEFVNQDIFADPTQRRRMRRLMNQERATFTSGGALAVDRQTGGVAGLREE